mmetsp:Transcript_40529/g.77845  ORF Transcript_40529/g.77845 Transcript_40529/m.77845 type:complete len:215 (+) Transcript_40529:28-672(+)
MSACSDKGETPVVGHPQKAADADAKVMPGVGIAAADRHPEAYILPGAKGQLSEEAINDVQLSDALWRERLSVNQYRVLRKKATEPRHAGGPQGFDDHFQPGVYLCGSCLAAGVETPVYTSNMKFDCGCGWPGFWTNVVGNVYEQRDADGQRSEILCARCGGHMGHVFRGEGMGREFGHSTDERHCVNSMSLVFAPADGGNLVQPIYAGPVYGGE